MSGWVGVDEWGEGIGVVGEGYLRVKKIHLPSNVEYLSDLL
jgi:hypothetical protein